MEDQEKPRLTSWLKMIRSEVVTHPCRVRLYDYDKALIWIGISIHAPA